MHFLLLLFLQLSELIKGLVSKENEIFQSAEPHLGMSGGTVSQVMVNRKIVVTVSTSKFFFSERALSWNKDQRLFFILGPVC